jgi:hypothetical protein
MTESRNGARFVSRIAGIELSEFSDIAARADECKVARDIKELGIMTAAPWRRAHT